MVVIGRLRKIGLGRENSMACYEVVNPEKCTDIGILSIYNLYPLSKAIKFYR